MGLRDLVRGFTNPGPVLRQDRPLWEAARTLQDLGDLTARWLAGDIQSQPGYFGPVDVDEDLAPGLTETLIALNQAGYLTDCSQAGAVGVEGYGGSRWETHAAVEGFATYDTYRWLRNALTGTRFTIVEDDCRQQRGRVVVTFVDGQPYTRFGAAGWNDVEFDYEVCGPDAIAALRDSWQVTIYDPVIGSNELWPVLLHAATSR